MSILTRNIAANLPANQIGSVPTLNSTAVGVGNPFLAIEADLELNGVISTAGEVFRMTDGTIRSRRLRPRVGVSANVVDPTTGQEKTIGVAMTHDYNMGITDELLGKAYMYECLVAFKQKVGSLSPADMQAMVNASYDYAKNMADASTEAAVNSAYGVWTA